MTEPVLYEERDDIAIITLNRPHKRNALNEAVIQGIADGIDAATKSADVAAIVLRGAGGTLTAGYDLGASSDEPDYVGWKTPYGAKGPKPREGAWDPVRDYQFMNNNVQRFMKIWECPKPVLGEITGWAVGGATDMVLCCDQLYMASNAHIGYAPSRVFGTPTTMMWMYRLGLEHAKQFLLTGRAIDAETAHRIGLVAHVVAPEDLAATLQPHPGKPTRPEQDADKPSLRKYGPAYLTDDGHLLRWRHPPYRRSLVVG
jgi:enoyl-CoA hydratase